MAKITKSNMGVIAAVVLLAGGAYLAATSASTTTQKLGLIGSGAGIAIVGNALGYW